MCPSPVVGARIQLQSRAKGLGVAGECQRFFCLGPFHKRLLVTEHCRPRFVEGKLVQRGRNSRGLVRLVSFDPHLNECSHPPFSGGSVSIPSGFALVTCGCSLMASMPLLSSSLVLHKDAYLKTLLRAH